MAAIDHAFKLHFFKAKLIHYITTLVNNHVYDIKERYQRFDNRNVLIMDKEINEDNTNVVLDMIQQKAEVNSNDAFNMCHSLIECISDEQIYNILKSLKPKQLKILDLMSIDGLTNNEIAAYFGESPQNISKSHRKVISLLRKSLGGNAYE